MSTRDNILAEARKLFNQNGLERTSAKGIAKALGISDGNLRYHFRTKADLVWALYQELVTHFDTGFEMPEDHVPDMQGYWDMLGFTFEQLEAYSFLMSDFAGLMRQYPLIHQHYRELQIHRRQQFAHLIQLWQGRGWLRKDLPPQQYEFLYHHLQTFHDFWLPEAYLLYEGPPEGKRHYYQGVAFAMLAPYLTPTGQAMWETVEQS